MFYAIYIQGGNTEILFYLLPYLRRLDAILEPTKDKVLARHQELNEMKIEAQSAQLCKVSGYIFYNTSKYTFKKLLNEPGNIRQNLETYLDGFSSNVQDIISEFKLRNQLETLEEGNIITKPKQLRNLEEIISDLLHWEENTEYSLKDINQPIKEYECHIIQMKCNKVQIQNYKGLSNLTFENLSNINIILGGNNHGKTSVLEAIDNTINAFGRFPYWNRERVPKYIFNFRYLFHQHNYDNTISVKIDDTMEWKLLPFDISNYHKPDLYEIARKGRNRVDENTPTTVSELYKGDKKVLERVYDSEGFRIYDAISEDKDEVRNVFINDNTKKDIEKVSITGAQQILIKRLEGNITRVLNRIDSKVTGWIFGQGDSILLDIDGQLERRPIEYMGDGFHKVFSLLTILENVKNGVILIDEIENSLHYKTIELIVKVLYEHCKENPNIQFFITTHSIDLLKSLNAFLQKQEDAEQYFSLYTMKKRSDGEFRVYHSDKDTLENYIETQSELR